jgi:hypothetical protein
LSYKPEAEAERSDSRAVMGAWMNLLDTGKIIGMKTISIVAGAVRLSKIG